MYKKRLDLKHGKRTHGLSKTIEYRRYKDRKRQTAKATRTPAWADQSAILAFYRSCPKGFEVDHIIPLRGKNVSGLHVVENLQYLTPDDNRRKNRKFTPLIQVSAN